MRTALAAGRHRVVGGWRPPLGASRLPPAATPRSPLPPRASVPKIPTAQDQGSIGDCAGQTGRECLTGVALRQGIGEELFSALYLYYWARALDGSPAGEDTGTYVETVFRVLAERGCPRKETWDDDRDWRAQPSAPADIEAARHRALLAFSLPNLTTIKASIVAGFGVGFGTILPKSFESEEAARSGLVDCPRSPDGWTEDGHALTIWAYDDDEPIFDDVGTLTLLNHWSRGWGVDGTCKVPQRLVSSGYASDFHRLGLVVV